MKRAMLAFRKRLNSIHMAPIDEPIATRQHALRRRCRTGIDAPLETQVDMVENEEFAVFAAGADITRSAHKPIIIKRAVHG